MATIKKLLVSLGLDKSDYDSGLEDAKKKTKSSVTEIGSSLQNLGDKLSGAGQGLSNAFTGKVVDGFKDAIDSASDLNETSNKIDAVFGYASGSVTKFAEGASTNLGQSKQNALDAAATFGVFGKAAGLTGNNLSEFSLELTSLASDFASFYNTSPEEAITSIGAALRGESEPIRKYGILLDDLTLKAKATAMGLDWEKTLTPSQKVLAAHAVILEQGALAQGDFAKTSDGLANSSRIADARIADFSAKLGQVLLPFALQLVQVGNSILAWLLNLDPGMQKAIVVVAALAGGLGPVLIIVGQLVTAIGAIIPVVSAVIPIIGGITAVLSGPVLVIGLIIAALVGLSLAWSNNWGGIQDKTKAAITNLKTNAAEMVSDIKKSFSDAWDSLKNIDWEKLGNNIVEGIANGITKAVDWIVKAAENVGGAALAAIKGFLGISSPSKVFEDQVGWQMGEGVRVGWTKSLTSLRGSLTGDINGVMAAGNISVPSAVHSNNSGQPIVFEYKPMISFADENEAQHRIEPFIRQALRKYTVGG